MPPLTIYISVITVIFHKVPEPGFYMKLQEVLGQEIGEPKSC